MQVPCECIKSERFYTHDEKCASCINEMQLAFFNVRAKKKRKSVVHTMYTHQIEAVINGILASKRRSINFS